MRSRRYGSGTVLLVRHSGVSGDINLVCAWVCAWDSEWGWGSNPLLQNLRVPFPPRPGPVHLLNLESRQLESFFWIRTYANTHNLVYQLQATLVLLEVWGCEGTPT